MVDSTLNVNYTPVTITCLETMKQHKHTMTKKKKSNIISCISFKRYIGLIVLAIIAVITGLTSIAVWKTGFLDAMITQRLVLANDSQVFDMWTAPPVQPLLKVYLFNYTNVKEFEEGKEKLRVQEVGPYVYRQTLTKVNVEFYSNQTVGFQQRRNYQFAPELSGGSLDDVVIAPNIALLSAIAQVQDSNYFMRLSLATVIGGLSVKPFHSLKVEDYLWGYDDPLFDMGKTIIQLQRDLPFDRLGILAGKNGTDMNHFSVFTGETDLRMLGIIASFNGQEKQEVWDGEECNRIDGSEGSMFPPPLVQEGKMLHVYIPDLCRRFPLAFQKPVVTHELPAMRFTPSDDIFSYSKSENNSCYCPKGECPPDGVFDASTCNFGGPAMISFPHFYQGQPDLLEHIDGLEPTKEKHEFYLDVHDRFGVILGGKSRMQLNLLAHSDKSFPCMKMFKKDILLPTAWFEVGVDDLPDFIKSDLQLATHTASHGLLYFLVTSFILSSAVFAYLVTKRTRKSQQSPLYIKDTILVPQVSLLSTVSHQ